MPGMWDYLTLLPSLSLCLSLYLSFSLCVFLSSFFVSLYLYLFLSLLFSLFFSLLSLSPLPIISRTISLLLKTQVIIWAHLNNLGYLLHLKVLNLIRQIWGFRRSLSSSKIVKTHQYVRTHDGTALVDMVSASKRRGHGYRNFQDDKTVVFAILGTGWIV